MEKGNSYSGFLLKDLQRLEEAASDVYLFEHIKSGARLLYMANKDDNKVFSISFRTPPKDDTGLPHILEHSVLCGSRKYPLKEPFVELVKGSLNTFVNAMTFPDKTMYPVASKNDKDFRNLIDVYLDAVFYPNIYQNKYTLSQEGWHYELLAKDAPLEYKGVVYNEMKGVYSSPDSILEQTVMRALFPSSPYSFEYGGDPDAIPSLTQADFEAFHREYYHPANSYIFLYGDLDIKEHLMFIDSEYLAPFDKIQINSAVPAQGMPPRTAEKTAYYPLTADAKSEEKAFFSWSAVVGSKLPAEEYFAFQLLRHYLLDTPAAPLKKALIDAKVAKEIAGVFTPGLLQPVFSVRAAGADPKKKDLFVSTIYRALQTITMKGIDKGALESSLNLFEFLLREADFGSYPKGLVYAISCMDSWLYGGDPLQYLRYEAVIKSLRAKINSRYYESLMENCLLDNTHRAIVALLPKEGMQKEKDERLREELKAVKLKWSPKEINDCLEDTQRLLQLQSVADSPELLAKIPLLLRSDINRETEKQDCSVSRRTDGEWLYLNKFTNKIAYVKICFSAAALPEELVPYAYLLRELLGRIDTEHYTYAELDKAVNFHTGGISCGFAVVGSQNDADRYAAKFTFSGKALVRNIRELCALLKEIATMSVFTDKKRLRELVEESKAGRDTGIFARGHDVVISRLFSYFSRSGRYAEQGQLSYYRFLHSLLKKPLDELGAKLNQTARLLFGGEDILFAVCCEKDDRESVENELAAAFKDLPRAALIKQDCQFVKKEINEGIITSAQVQHVAAGGNFKIYGHEYTGAMRVLENILRYDYLWNNIRVKGGAYGANASFDYNGTAVFSSYRDPNLAATLAVFRGIAAYLSAFAASEREMTKYVIGTISQLDRPLTPSRQLDRVLALFIRGIEHGLLQKERDQILASSVEDIKKLGKILDDLLSDGYLCVLGGEDKIKADAASLGILTAVLPEN